MLHNTSRDVYEYTLTIPKDTKQVSFAPESFNRYDKITIQSNGNEYRYGAAIPVEEGTIVNITSVPVSYTTPVEPDAKVTYQVTVKNEDDSQNPDPEKPDPQEPEKERNYTHRYTVWSESYRKRIDKRHAACCLQIDKRRCGGR